MSKINVVNERIREAEKIIGSNYRFTLSDIDAKEYCFDNIMLNILQCRVLTEGVCRYVVLVEKLANDENSIKNATLSVYIEKIRKNNQSVPKHIISDLVTIQNKGNLAAHYQTGGPLDRGQLDSCVDALSDVLKWFVEKYRVALYSDFELTNTADVNHSAKAGQVKGTVCEERKLVSILPEPITVIGRDQELKSLADTISTYKKVMVTGIGGIGKTAFLNAFCHSGLCSNRYSTIIYLSVGGDLVYTLSSDSQLKLIMNDTEGKKRMLADSLEYATYKLEFLDKYVDDNTLIVIDNMDLAAGVLHKRICSLKCDLVVATRQSTNEFFMDFHEFKMAGLQSEQNIHELFELYYGQKLGEEEYPLLDELLADVRFHTMTIVLLAKQMRYFGKVPSDYQNKNQIRLERANHLTQIMASCCNDTDVAEMYINLFGLFDSSLLSAEEKKVMKTMCVIPLQGLQRHFYVQLVGEECIGALEKMEEIGWAQNNCDKSVVLMHPLVRDVVEHELGVYIDDPDISSFISRFIEVIFGSWNKVSEVNEKYKELALSIYYQFPTPTKTKYRDYLVLSRLFRNLDCVDIALEIQDKVKGLFIDAGGKHADSVDEAEALMQIGYTYHAKGDYANAAAEFEKAVGIYGDNYANSLAFLAQGYLLDAEKEFADIEPLLKESLLIREKYCRGTMAEASSCHMYAKTLSAYDRDLEYALTLEKRAYKIHSAIRPGDSLMSSSAYILGWLFVQTANNKDDIADGIEKLEESKRIRLKFYSNPTYWWMEDIYHKLGMAYEKYEDLNKALEYYKLLLEIRTNKYGEDSSDKKMIEVHRLLLRVYEALEDEEGIRKCRKYLRYHS